MDKYTGLESRQYNVWASRKIFPVNPKAIALGVQEFSNNHLRLGILAPDSAHHARSGSWVNDVHFFPLQRGFMSRSNPIQIVDLFAGPGGLGEGFSSYDNGDAFEIIVSAEMEPSAHSTLRLRAFYRYLKKFNPEAMDDYYSFCHTASMGAPYTERSKGAWLHAEREAQQIELGTDVGNKKLDEILEDRLDETKPWVLIGGPPCQAYSLAGRSRNKGNLNYRAESDHRHFLYREYLRIIQRKKPTIFVMENVKGILSSKVGGELMFPKILEDLAAPDVALGEPDSGQRYRICSLVSDDIYVNDASFAKFNPSNFIIRSELFGVPQARHRVILLGISEDLFNAKAGGLARLRPRPSVSVGEAIGGLPPLRSKVTGRKDDFVGWVETVTRSIKHLNKELKSRIENEGVEPEAVKLSVEFDVKARCFSGMVEGRELDSGGLRVLKSEKWLGETKTHLDNWFQDKNLNYWLNHEARGHMESDLQRYVYAAEFSRIYQRSPKGHNDFNLPGLAPNHKNWESGNFGDRFRVQLKNYPSTTITSHIAKDGHYFIHYDSSQCRSLTVREAARLQTFPDNYFFLGNRTQQFHQVGNAVPPFLAQQIASIVAELMGGEESYNVRSPISQMDMSY
jgi:DNA (cytosine-5)-methyltransferase 1